MSTTTRTSTAAIATGTWSVDPSHSTVGFSVKHMGIATVRGEFTEFEGALVVADDGAMRVAAMVRAASVDTKEQQRDDHLRSPDFFNAEAHPQLTLQSTSVTQPDDETIEVRGRLSINGVTNDIVLTGDILGTDIDPWGNERVGIEMRGQLSRGDYNMRFNQALGSGNMLVGDKVKIAIDVSLVKQQ
ncbi:MAG: YceI family protein [Thermoleophilia bacterium]